MSAPMRHVSRCCQRRISSCLRVSGNSESKTRVLSAFSTYFDTKKTVLGIETSCDDTGAAVVDNRGRVLGEALNSQVKVHVEAGGILPPVARNLHVESIAGVVQEALDRASMTVHDVDAVAVTVEPGLALCLKVGLDHAKSVVRHSGKPLIPIHHMQAHALMARMSDRVDFPFLVLLISGGHCLLAVAKDVADFVLLGESLDDAPGEAFDKIARQLNLKNLPQFSSVSGGVAIETLAREGNPKAFDLPLMLTQIRTCDFSFSGLKSQAKRFIAREEERQGVSREDILPNVADICASFQYGVLKHLARRVQRSLLFCELHGLLPKHKKTLVVSGGVGSNQFIRSGLQKVCDMYSTQLVCPPPRLCTDNGVMIAWNGMEKLLSGQDFSAAHPEAVDFQPKCPIGEDISSAVRDASIKLPPLKLL
ncbi:probable tRNA N6-adenosine threonylcarbamoyltransferase, mitochondrial [Haliotis rufescens]|uniref:probable tRNA N6-adenosine threonylcarbamoyltransferase, mitochondrial n=1 Tax=Haliotis rufescens TaxID=6454 RepID=UPI00201F68E3|nr:probable tRNA N6-adenosine threonylcarbamoyltransferase, mitochondrial [Haliotis rufescens]